MFVLPENSKLRLTCVASTILSSFVCNGVMVRQDGEQHPFQIDVRTDAAFTAVSREQQLPAGVLLWAAITQTEVESGNANKYAKLQILDHSMSDTQEGSTICEGYVDQNESVAFPGSGRLPTQSGMQPVSALEYSQSSAGAANITFITLQVLSRIDVIRFKYVAASAESSTRAIGMSLYTPDGLQIGLGSVNALTNTTNQYQLTRNLVPTPLPSGFTGFPIPPLVMGKAWTFRLAITNSHASDVASDLMIAGTGRVWFSGI